MDPYGCPSNSQAYPPQAYPAESHHGMGCHLASYFANRPTMKVYCMAAPHYALTVRNNQVILAQYSPSDPTQQWYKDEKFSTTVRDEEGFPAFSLVNKATGQALKHSVGASYPVQLAPYNPNELDSSVLWSMSKDFGFGYRAMRMINNIGLNMDAFHGDKKNGVIYEGTLIVLWKWNHGENQRWIVAPTH